MKDNYYFLYYFFDSPIIRWVRVIIFFAVGIFVYSNLNNQELVISLLPFYFFLLLQEFFIHFSLENRHPPKKITDSLKHVIECVDYKVRSYLERHHDIGEVIKHLLNDHNVKYFNRILDLDLKIEEFDVREEDLLTESKKMVEGLHGQYIHAIDIYVSYLILLDKKNRFLFERGLDIEDVIILLSWIRKKTDIDGKKHKELRFSGSGVFDFFVYGWSSELSKYASDYTKEVLQKPFARPLGRKREYELLITALSKSNSSNALLIGDAGIGKSSLIAQFTLDSNMAKLPRHLSNKTVFKLYPERLIAGIDNIGDLESRFVGLFSELIHAGNIVVYIPNIENIFGGGGLNVDISGVIVEYLKSNRIKIIGTTTPASFRQFVYPKQEIKELFDTIELIQPDKKNTLFMLFEKAEVLSRDNRLQITYQAIKEARDLSSSYANDGTALPGRAIRLLEDVIAYQLTHGNRKITQQNIRDFIQEKTQIVLDKPSEEESKKLLNLESELHKQVVSQNEAISAISDALRRVRSGVKEGGKPIASFLFLGPTGVGKTEAAKALAKSYFGDEEAMIRLDMSEYQNTDSIDRFLGGQNNQESLADKIIKTPFRLILLDEFEKANISIRDLFLQILDEGRLTDNLGRTVSFSQAIIIATSNAGSEFIREEYKEGVNPEDIKKRLIERVLQQGIFKPELVNRFDDVIIFKSLSHEDAAKVAEMCLASLRGRMEEKQIIIKYEPEVAEFIAQNSYSIEFGARNIKRFIEQSVENQLSKLILSGQIRENMTVKIAISEGKLVIQA